MNTSGDRRLSTLAPRLNDLTVALALFGFALAIRSVSFHRSVIDWDESLYFLMAEAWRAGHLPYTTLWDNKPIGIYAIFAVFQALFGDHVAAMRLAAVAAVSATAFLLYRLYLNIGTTSGGIRPKKSPALVAAILYLLASTRDGGMAANTELFIAPFVCGSLLFALSARRSLMPAFLSGLLLGLAFIVKYVALFEFAAPVFALLMLPSRAAAAPGRITLILGFAAGAATPMMACLSLYIVTGHGDVFVAASLAANVRRLDMPFSFELARRALHDHAAAFVLPYCAFVLLPVSLARAFAQTSDVAARHRDAVIAAILLLWVAGALVGTASAKLFYPHYFLQPLPALCLTAVWVSGRVLPFAGLTGFALALALLLQPLAGARDAIAETWSPVRLDGPGIGLLRDEPARIAFELRPIVAGLPGTPLYVVDYQPILYSLTSVKPPTRFAFPSFICKRFLSRVVDIDAGAEFASIAAKRPHFIIRSRDPHPNVEQDNVEVYVALDALLKSHYRLWKTYPDALVYRLASDS